ncbi:hypothetical protein BDR03DRAFT_1005176 [Suillus americanus]|nr:hypothetical protein BDR03DRAFT_1005176 [Suillus americanus]
MALCTWMTRGIIHIRTILQTGVGFKSKTRSPPDFHHINDLLPNNHVNSRLIARDLLPTNFVRTTLCVVQNDGGNFRVDFQNKDYQINEMSLNDPKSMTHTMLKLDIPAARINTPIAVVACNKLQEPLQIYITVNSRVHHSQRHGWQKGATIGTAVENSTCLYAQGRFTHNETILRDEFQSTAAPRTVTEACTMGDEWKSFSICVSQAVNSIYKIVANTDASFWPQDKATMQ